jgi:hypothetical protein
MSSVLLAVRREFVLSSYNYAKAENHKKFIEGDDKATSEYIQCFLELSNVHNVLDTNIPFVHGN